MNNRRRIQSAALLALAALSVLSCAKYSGTEQTAAKEGEGCLVTFTVGGPQSRAGDYTTVLSYEKQLSSLQLVIYNKNGSSGSGSWTIEASSSETYPSAVTSATFSTRLSAGEYYVVAIANSDEDYTGSTYAYIEDNLCGRHYLSDEEDYSTGGFQAFGAQDLTVSGDDASASVSLTLDRFVGRVTLQGIYNYTGKAVTVNRVWLSNTVTKYDSGGTNSWGNIMGRYSTSDSGSIIAGSSDADCPNCTFRTVGRTLASNGSYTTAVTLYALANSSSVTPSGWSSSWSNSAGEKTTLVIDATMDGTQCYYPVVLDGISANYTYTVSVKLYRIGSPDPNDPDGEVVTVVPFTATVSVDEWDDGVEYSYE